VPFRANAALREPMNQSADAESSNWKLVVLRSCCPAVPSSAPWLVLCSSCDLRQGRTLTWFLLPLKLQTSRRCRDPALPRQWAYGIVALIPCLAYQASTSEVDVDVWRNLGIASSQDEVQKAWLPSCREAADLPNVIPRRQPSLPNSVSGHSELWISHFRHSAIPPFLQALPLYTMALSVELKTPLTGTYQQPTGL
jgi:hypothetical protein